MFDKKQKQIAKLTFERNHHKEIATRRLELIEDYENTWKSPEGQVILNDFQRALNLILDYQRALNVVGAPDPSVLDSRLLLAKYGSKGMTSAHGVPGLEEFIQVREKEETSGPLKR